jgi:hypothetical protein
LQPLSFGNGTNFCEENLVLTDAILKAHAVGNASAQP